MLSDEERKAIDYWKTHMEILHWNTQLASEHYIKVLLDIIEKQSKEIEELKRERETNQQMIHLAETQILGYAQGYKDGLNKETTATEIVARERENQIIYEGMKHKINMQWVLKIKAKIEELEKQDKENKLSHNYLVIPVLQSLLEKE